MKRVYLDYAATTPVDPRVLGAMKTYFTEEFGNPGSLHSFGQRASSAVFDARQIIARAIGAHYSEIVFTGSATEANNHVLGGVMRRFVRERIKAKQKPFMPRIVISAVEHESILKTAQELEKDGAQVVIIPVDKNGVVDMKKLKKEITANTAIVSVMYANNEIGTIQPIAEISKLVRTARGSGQWPLLHTDAVQAFQYLNCDVNTLGVDLLTLSAHKICGPKGIGALYVRGLMSAPTPGKPLRPIIAQIITGGGQEQGLRSGTENVPYIVGFGKAVELVEKMREHEVKRICDLRAYAWRQIKQSFTSAQMNGGRTNRIPNNLNFYLPKLNAEKILVGLDMAGIAVSSGPACSARSLEPSHVLRALGFTNDRSKNSIRISLGRMTTKGEIDYFLATLKKIL